MGLDQFVTFVADDLGREYDIPLYNEGGEPINRVQVPDRKFTDIEKDIGEEYFADEFFYWRKHPNLHGWVTNLYIEKKKLDPDVAAKHDRDGLQWGSLSDGNVLITAADLDRLERDMDDNALSTTTGFFFGGSGEYEEKQTRVFIEKARAAIKDGYKLVYYASW